MRYNVYNNNDSDLDIQRLNETSDNDLESDDEIVEIEYKIQDDSEMNDSEISADYAALTSIFDDSIP